MLKIPQFPIGYGFYCQLGDSLNYKIVSVKYYDGDSYTVCWIDSKGNLCSSAFWSHYDIAKHEPTKKNYKLLYGVKHA